MSNDDAIARCQVPIEDAQRALARAGRYSLSDALLAVLETHLPQLSDLFRTKDEDNNALSSTLRRRQQEKNDLLQRLASEQQALSEAQQRVQALLERIQRRDSTINQHLQRIGALGDALEDARNNALRQHQEGFEAGRQAERNAQNQPRNDTEDLIQRQMEEGAELFNEYNFAGALVPLSEAQQSILLLPATRRQLFDNTKLSYQIAVCGAYVTELGASEKSLSDFVRAPFSSTSSEEKMLSLAHAQHLLAQVYIGQGRLQDARITCEQSSGMRRQYLQTTDNRRYQSTALSARLMELEGRSAAADTQRTAIRDPGVRDALKAAYSKLKPLQATARPRNEAYVLSEPATELLPIWNMISQAGQPPMNPPGASDDGTPSARPPPAFPSTKRAEWLDSLNLVSNSGETLDPSLRQAIRAGDAERVSQILPTLPTSRVVAPALHIAALFNDIEIATALLTHNHRLARTPCNGTSDTGGHLHGILPMHCAVGAQRPAMIRLLHSHGADFLATTRLDDKKRVSAPPLWLVSERWLRLTGKADSESVIGILELMKSLGWKKRDAINREGYSMRRVVERNLGSRSDLQRRLLRWLN